MNVRKFLRLIDLCIFSLGILSIFFSSSGVCMLYLATSINYLSQHTTRLLVRKIRVIRDLPVKIWETPEYSKYVTDKGMRICFCRSNKQSCVSFLESNQILLTPEGSHQIDWGGGGVTIKMRIMVQKNQ